MYYLPVDDSFGIETGSNVEYRSLNRVESCVWLACFFTRILEHNCMTQSKFGNCDCFTLKMGHAVAQLVEARRYNPEGRGFDSRWCYWNFSLT
jgi:hypothetical protein